MIEHNRFIDILTLSEKHQDALLDRGFNLPQLSQLQYRTYPARRMELAAKLSELIDPNKVPGFWRNGKGWQLAGAAGILIPVRDINANIVSFKIRIDTDKQEGKYITLSSNPAPNKDGEVKYPNGTAGKIAVHHPNISLPKDILIITEGEIKADLTSFLWEKYTISIPGISNWEMALDSVKTIKPHKILLAFDTDKNKEYSSSKMVRSQFIVGKTLAQLYLTLKKSGYNVTILDWPEEYGKGIDDVLANGHADQIKELTEMDCKVFCATVLSKEMPLDWVYINSTKRFYHVPSRLELDKEQFSDKYSEMCKKGRYSDKALKNPAFPKVDLPIYEPGEIKIIEREGNKYLNLWDAHIITPVAGTADLFIEHINYVLPDPEDAAILLNFLAFNVQFPGQKIHWAVLLQGDYGIGKSYFKLVMRKIIGEHNVSCPSNESIHEIYTGWARNCQLVIVEELMARGRLELMNKLKEKITESTTTVREMHKMPYEQPNRFNFLMFTNHEDAIIIDKNERRYAVLYSPAKPRSEDYYIRLFDWTEKNYGEIYYVLKNRDLSKFNPKSHAPHTIHKDKLIINSMHPLEYWMRDAFESKEWPFHCDIINVDNLLDVMPHYLKAHSPQIIGRMLGKLGAEQYGQVKLSSGRMIRVWMLRNSWAWKEKGKQAIVSEYERWFDSAQPGSQNPLKDSQPY